MVKTVTFRSFSHVCSWDIMVISYHDTAVLWATGNDVVIVRTKLYFQDRAGVATHSGVGHVNAPCLQRETLKKMLNRPYTTMKAMKTWRSGLERVLMQLSLRSHKQIGEKYREEIPWFLGFSHDQIWTDTWWCPDHASIFKMNQFEVWIHVFPA